MLYVVGPLQLEDEEDSTVMGHVREKLSWRLLPSVFDSVDLHVGKVTALNICTQLQADTGIHCCSPQEFIYMIGENNHRAFDIFSNCNRQVGMFISNSVFELLD